MRKLLFSRESLKFIEGLDAKRYRQVVSKALSLQPDPRPNDSKQLKGTDVLRADVGEYRIVYRFDSDTVYIDNIGKRNDDEVYRHL